MNTDMVRSLNWWGVFVLLVLKRHEVALFARATGLATPKHSLCRATELLCFRSNMFLIIFFHLWWLLIIKKAYSFKICTC